MTDQMRPPCCIDSGEELCPQHAAQRRQHERQVSRARALNPAGRATRGAPTTGAGR